MNDHVPANGGLEDKAEVMGPLDRMILAAVKCLTCGAGYGECDCAEKHKNAWIEAEYQRLMALPDEELIAECAKVGVHLTPEG